MDSKGLSPNFTSLERSDDWLSWIEASHSRLVQQTTAVASILGFDEAS